MIESLTQIAGVSYGEETGNSWQMLPGEFEAAAYRSLQLNLAHMSDAELLDHYDNFGRNEGRTANGLRDRNDFAALVPKNAAALEIGPYSTPLLRGANVSYFDVLSQKELVARAKLRGHDPGGVPYIDYVSPTAELSIVDRSFDVVLSSHCLEHQPDLVGHLQGVGELLRPGGAYFLLVPDKRYCFDHFTPLSNLAEIIVAYRERRKVHTLRAVIENHALATHNDSLRHWQGDHGTMFGNSGGARGIRFDNFEQRLQAALQEFNDAKGKYIDVHTWYFTPQSACSILSVLRKIGLIRLAVHRVYPTRYGANEFWMILIPDGPGREALGQGLATPRPINSFRHLVARIGRLASRGDNILEGGRLPDPE